jgi:hypothetical protein
VSDDQKIRDRIGAFIREHYRLSIKNAPRDLAEAVLKLERAETVGDSEEGICQHFTSKEACEEEVNHFSWPPEHLPARERILFTRISQTEALVETEAGSPSIYYNYHLRKIALNWLIESIRCYSSDKDEPVTNEIDLGKLLVSLPDPIRLENLPEGLERLFESPATLETRFGRVATHIQHAGTLNFPSGFIACDDPGLWPSGASVFPIKVPPGDHQLELVTGAELGGIVGAARLVFSSRAQVAQRTYAVRRAGNEFKATNSLNSHIIGVDGGMIALADAEALQRLTKREREDLHSRMATASTRQQAFFKFAKLGRGLKSASISSGCGDGGYPAYWLLGKHAEPISLIFDFCDLALPVFKTFQLRLVDAGLDAKLSLPELTAGGIHIRFISQRTNRRMQRVLTVSGPQSVDIKLIDDRGGVIFESGQGGCMINDEGTTYYLPPEFPRKFSGILQANLYLGHRYQFLEDSSRA